MRLTVAFEQSFSSLANDIERNLDEWKQWYDLDAPEGAEFPSNYREKMNNFQVLMFMRCFRIDRVYRAVTNYIMESMGEQYVTPPVIR